LYPANDLSPLLFPLIEEPPPDSAGGNTEENDVEIIVVHAKFRQKKNRHLI
jgi:hypothetical protein